MLRKCNMTLFKPTRAWDATSAQHNGPHQEVATVRGFLHHGRMSQQQTDVGIGDTGNWMWFGRLPRDVEHEMMSTGNTPARGWEAEVQYAGHTMRLNVMSAYYGLDGWQLRLERVN